MLNKGISTPIAIGIILILVILVGSFTWLQYGEMWRESTELPEIELPEKETKEEAIKKLLAEKYDKEISEVTININQETENHLRGGVVFQPGGSENSGLFLAAKVNGEWKLVHDGHGAILCLTIAEYDFPADMVKQCVGGDTIVEDRREEACLKSGGQVTISPCCKSTEDYPNLCLIGPCGCAPTHSHQVKICDCGEGKCFDGNECVAY